MQRNFILTDVMKTGYHMELEQFINYHTMPNQTFEMTGEYYTLHEYDLDSFDRKFAVIDYRAANHRLNGNPAFMNELRKRCELLHSQGFVFVLANPWESVHNMNIETHYPKIDVAHMKWAGGVSWFWYLMYNKHKHNKFKFTHDHNGSYWHKKHDFLYLNKASRLHRIKLYDQLSDKGVLENSIHTFHQHKTKRLLPREYELPGVLPESYPRFGMDQDIYEAPYNDTVCSLVSETNDTNDEIFMTEKIWKPIIAQHVFVVHGNYLYLQKLREMGFKTFANYFDETYDLEKDSDKRIDKLVSLCTDLKRMCSNGSAVESGNKKWQDVYMQSLALRQHNYNNFFNKEKMSLQINKTLELFLEFADSSQVSS